MLSVEWELAVSLLLLVVGEVLLLALLQVAEVLAQNLPRPVHHLLFHLGVVQNQGVEFDGLLGRPFGKVQRNLLLVLLGVL